MREVDESLGGDVRPGDEGAEVHLDERREPHVVAQDVPHGVDLDPFAHELDGRKPERLLVALGRRGRERARRHPAEIHEVGRQPCPRDQAAVDEHRPLHHHVLRMETTAVVRVIGEVHVARTNGVRAEPGERAPDGVRGGPPVQRDDPAACDQTSAAVGECGGVVLPLGDDRVIIGLYREVTGFWAARKSPRHTSRFRDA